MQTSTVTNQTNSLMTGLFTQEINALNLLVPLHRRRCCFCKNTKMETGFLCSRRRTPGFREKAPDKFYLRLSQRRSSVLILALAARPFPTNPAFFFPLFFKHVGSGSCSKSGGGGGEEVKEEGKKERGKTAPGLEEDIVCMCTEAQGLWPAA